MKDHNDKEKIRRARPYDIALAGIMLALSVVVLFFASIVPGIELTILAVSGVLMLIVVHELNVSRGILLFIATVILSFLIVPQKAILLIYSFVFGPYSIIKSLIERHVSGKVFRFALKLLAFNLFMGAGFFFFREVFFAGIKIPDIAWYLLFVGAQFMLFLYDNILSMIMIMYERVIPKKYRGDRI